MRARAGKRHSESEARAGRALAPAQAPAEISESCRAIDPESCAPSAAEDQSESSGTDPKSTQESSCEENAGERSERENRQELHRHKTTQKAQEARGAADPERGTAERRPRRNREPPQEPQRTAARTEAQEARRDPERPAREALAGAGQATEGKRRERGKKGR